MEPPEEDTADEEHTVEGEATDTPHRGAGALRAVLVLLLLALLPRLVVVSAPAADLWKSNPRAPRIYVGEEIARGNVAQELRRGPLLPFIDYQYAHFFGGSLVTALLAVPAFALLGPNLFALKLVPIAFHLAALACLFALLNRFVSRRAAWIGGLLFAWTPPGYTLLSTVAWGSHVESNLLALACTWQLLEIHRAGAGAHGRRRFFLGLSEGFALYFGYQCALFVAVLLVLDLLRDRRFLLVRSAWIQVAGGVIGLLPWLAYNLRNDFAGLGLYGRSLSTRLTAGSGPLARAGELATHGLPGSAYFPELLGVPGAVLGAALFAALFLLALAALRRPRANAAPTPAAAAWSYLVLFALAYTFSDFPIGHKPHDVGSFRYAMLTYPFLVIAAATGADRIATRLPRLARPLAALACALALTCAAGILPSTDRAQWGASWRAPGYNTVSLGSWIAVRYVGRLENYDRVVAGAVERRDSEERQRIFTGMSRVLGFLARDEGGEYERARAHMRAIVPEAYAHQFDPK